MKEAKIAFWEDGEWNPQEDHVFLNSLKIEDLPRPRFFPGQKIKFRWSDGHKEGILVKVSIVWEEDFFSFSRKKIYTLGYEVKCIGHNHRFYDKIYEEESTEFFGAPKKNTFYEAQRLKE